MAERTTKAKAARAGRRDLDRRIVDQAVARACEVGWDRVRLRQVADDLGISLAELQARFRDLDAVANGWFARPLASMLAAPEPGFDDLPARERVYLVLMRWFEASAAHRRLVGQMLNAKLYPSHPHHWVPMIFDLSRLIQWLREAARLDGPGVRRQVEEIGLTLLFLATLAVWLRDDTPDQAATRRALRRRLTLADGVLAFAGRMPRPRPGPRRRAGAGRKPA